MITLTAPMRVLAKQTAENQLVTAQETIEEQAAALISSAGAQGTSASADGGTEEAGDAPMDMISRPKPPKGKRVRIRRSMGVEEDVYKAIQVSTLQFTKHMYSHG